MNPPLHIGFPRLAQHEGKTVTLLFYLDIDNPPGTKGYNYRTLFKFTTGMYLIEKIPVEIILNFSPNTEYVIRQNGALEIKQNKNKKMNRKILIPQMQKIKKLGDIIKNKGFLNYKFESTKGKKDFTPEILNQFVLVNNDIIIPCSLIASKFYFTSSRIIPHILYNTLDRTHDGIEQLSNNFNIKLKYGYSDVDSRKIIFYTFDEYANKALLRLSNYYQKRKQSNATHFSIWAEFPFYGEYNFELFFMEIDGYKLVNSFTTLDRLPFNNFRVTVIRTKKILSDDIQLTEIKERSIPQFVAEDVSGVITQEFPKKYMKTGGLRINEEKEESMPVEKKVSKEQSKIKFKTFFKQDYQETDGLSQQQPIKSFDKQNHVIPVTFLRERSTKNQDEFTLEDFVDLLKLLEKVHSLKIFKHITRVPIVNKSRNNINQFEYYDENGNIRRRCIIAYFLYENRYVLLFEIDQKGFKIGTSTFVFISKSIIKNKASIIREFFSEYVRGVDKNTIVKKFLEKFCVNLIYKKHPLKRSKNLSISWCNTLINKINHHKL